jgi:hypothetical protein
MNLIDTRMMFGRGSVGSGFVPVMAEDVQEHEYKCGDQEQVDVVISQV